MVKGHSFSRAAVQDIARCIKRNPGRVEIGSQQFLIWLCGHAANWINHTCFTQNSDAPACGVYGCIVRLKVGKWGVQDCAAVTSAKPLSQQPRTSRPQPLRQPAGAKGVAAESEFWRLLAERFAAPTA
jgi:hypothetical protein